MKSKLLVILLVLSLVVNAYFVVFGMQTYINDPQKENEDLKAQINQNNKALQPDASLSDPYSKKVLELENYFKKDLIGVKGFYTEYCSLVMSLLLLFIIFSIS
ncbi:MAG TPA: hypothetical protein VFD03_03775 [Clostridia bacterium]|nr:hypothetical protein [Clostridia bacterium]